METINRQQKLEYLDAALPPAPDYYLSVKLAKQSNLFPEGETVAHHYESAHMPGRGDRRLWDFEVWLHNDPDAEQFRDADTPILKALPAYRRAIKDEHQLLDEHLPLLQQSFCRRLDVLAQRGHIPSILAERLNESGLATHVRFGIYDSFIASQYPEALGRRTSAFYLPDKHVMYFRPFATVEQIKNRYVHESFHAISGTTTYKDSDRLYSSRTGLGTSPVGEKGYSSEEVKHRAINEGVTEYLTNLTHKGRPGAVSPEKRGERDSGAYKVEREIVQILADRIGLDKILNAYAEDYEHGKPNTFEHTREFVRAIRSIYGPGFLGKLDKVDQERGVEAALTYIKAAEYLINTKQKQRSLAAKIGRALSGLRTTI
jgi:hypothetical protein